MVPQDNINHNTPELHCKTDVCVQELDSIVYLNLGPNIHPYGNYGTGIVFIRNMLSWLSFHNLYDEV